MKVLQKISTAGEQALAADLSGPIFDRKELGRRIRAARILSSETPETIADRVVKMGYPYSYNARALLSLERGDITRVDLELFFALVAALRPADKLNWFASAIRPDVAEALGLSVSE